MPRKCERRAEKRLHVDVLDLVAQLDIEYRKIPLDSLAQLPARAKLELPSLLRMQACSSRRRFVLERSVQAAVAVRTNG